MTTPTTTPASSAPGTDRRSLLPHAVAAWLLGVALTAVGTFTDLTGNDSGDEEDEVVAWFVLVAVLAVITWVVYRFWYERAAAADVAPGSALAGGILAAVTVLAFWTGLPCVFAVGALELGRRGGGPRAAIGMALSVLAIVAAVWLAIVG
jgi:RsiW-degrading membrane proteinase PrsW (M82 family)